MRITGVSRATADRWLAGGPKVIPEPARRLLEITAFGHVPDPDPE